RVMRPTIAVSPRTGETLSSESDDCAEPLSNISEDFRRDLRAKNGSTRLPVEVLDVIGQYDARDLAAGRKRYFERGARGWAGHGAGNRESGLAVVQAG